MLDLLSAKQLQWAVGIVLLTLAALFFQRLHQERMRYKGLPGPPHNYFLGSIPAMARVAMRSPPNAAPQAMFQVMKDYYDLPDVFYFDPWPLAPGVMAIVNIDIAHDLITKNHTLKHPVVDDFMINFGGPSNLVSSEGAVWKRWRSAFNPGFSPTHLMSQVPIIVEECKTFCDVMTERAKRNDLFRLEQAATKLTVSIIGKIVLDLDLDVWHGSNTLVDAFNSNVRWQEVGVQFQPSELWDIRRPIIQRYNNYRMNKYLDGKLEERFASRDTRGRTKHVIDLALETYLKEQKGTTSDSSKPQTLDAEFKQAAISNMKTFVFAGHDTTSSTICYAFYYLSKNPAALAKIRKEHADIFGTDPKAVEEKLKSDPHLINKLEYTYAVTREALRLQPPASTVRKVGSDFQLRHPETGEILPTHDNLILWPVNVAMHRNSKYWKDPHTFNPDRWISPDSTDNREAFIAFSKGTRNCIGQELAIIETKVILAMVVRRFDFTAAYDEVDKLKGDGSAYPSLTKGVLEMFGERAYQVQLGTAKPNEGMPCRLKLRT